LRFIDFVPCLDLDINVSSSVSFADRLFYHHQKNYKVKINYIFRTKKNLGDEIWGRRF